MSLQTQRIVFVGVIAAMAFAYWGVTGSTGTGGGSRSPASFSGTGTETTTRTHLSGDYEVSWTAADRDSPNVGCYHGVNLRGERSDPAIVSVMPDGGQTLTGTTHEYGLPAGDYYLEVNSGCSWTVLFRPI